MAFPLYYAYDGQAPPRRAGAAHATIYPYGPFRGGRRQDRDARVAERARMGRLLRAGARAARACRQTNASRRTRAARRAGRSCARSSSPHSRRITAAQVIARLDEASIANARMNDMSEVWEHPQLAARQRWSQVDTSAGPIPRADPARGAARSPRRAWIRSRRSASTPTRSCGSWATTKRSDRAAARTTRRYEIDDDRHDVSHCCACAICERDFASTKSRPRSSNARAT